MEYFCEGVADSFEKVRLRAQDAAGAGEHDQSGLLRRLDPRQRKALELFRDNAAITSSHLEQLFGISQRTARNVLAAWVENGFIVVGDPARKTRRYFLSAGYATLVKLR